MILSSKATSSGLLPAHVACDRRAPAYPRNGGDVAFVPWLLDKMTGAIRKQREETRGKASEEDAGTAGAEWAADAVVARLRDEVPLPLATQ